MLLREWRQRDLDDFAVLNADLRVIEHIPASLRDAFVRERIVSQFAETGSGLWAVEVPEVTPFLGFGLMVHTFEADFTPCVEIGGVSLSRTGARRTRPRLHWWLPRSGSNRRVWMRSCR